MVRRSLLLGLIAFVATTWFAAPAAAQEPTTIDFATIMAIAKADSESLTTEESGLTLTLEELERIVGRQNLCGALCGRFLPKCSVSCGDAAGCTGQYCVYL
jgi:hypothetical protein